VEAAVVPGPAAQAGLAAAVLVLVLVQPSSCFYHR
jgi:hypothetical protein